MARHYTPKPIAGPLPNIHVPLPSIIDVVYTYVDSADPAWKAAAAKARLPVASVMNKYRNWNELRFSMRSVHMYAPWVGRIFVIVASPSQVPAWINASHERIRIVYHEQIFDNASTQLPTFNSLAIETVLHRIETLSDYFLYFNNDVFIGRPLSLSTMITPDSYKRYLQNWRTATLRLNPICQAAMRPSNGNMPRPKTPLPSLELRLAHKCTRNNQFFWDRALAAFHWNVPVDYWFAHVPHLWQRRVMYAIEQKLAEPIAVCRRNKWRDADTDVSMNIQYESWLLAESNKRTRTERHVVDLPVERRPWENRFKPFHAHIPFYLYRTIPAPDTQKKDYRLLDFAAYKAQLDADYRSLDKLLEAHPQFIALEDDLKTADEAEMEYHRTQLESLMTKHWPTAAPWEIPT